MSWAETCYFIIEKSKDPITQVGCCIVNPEQRIVGVGYNGVPNSWSNDTFPWGKDKDVKKNKYLYVCHAAMNAIVNKYAADLKECILYTTLFPCNECAKLIVQSGIKEVVYMLDNYASKNEVIASKRMLDEVKIKYRQTEIMGIKFDDEIEEDEAPTKKRKLR